MTKLGFFCLHQSSTEPFKYKTNVTNLSSLATYLYKWKYSSIWNKTFSNIPSLPLKGFGPLFIIGMYGDAGISDDPDCVCGSVGIRESSNCIASEAGVAFEVLVALSVLAVDEFFTYVEINIEIMVSNNWKHLLINSSILHVCSSIYLDVYDDSDTFYLTGVFPFICHGKTIFF